MDNEPSKWTQAWIAICIIMFFISIAGCIINTGYWIIGVLTFGGSFLYYMLRKQPPPGTK